MEHLSLEIFDLEAGANGEYGSKFAFLPEDASVTITKTSEIFASGDVWSYSFTLNIPANAHIFGSAGDIHGSRLHDIIHKRKARLWAEKIPLYLGYLTLEDEADVDKDGNVDVSFESGQKTFDEMIEGTKAREVSVGDVVIGIALNRKRVSKLNNFGSIHFTLDGLEGYAVKDENLKGVNTCLFSQWSDIFRSGTPYVQRWPKLVKSHGQVFDEDGNEISGGVDYTNVQTPYDAGHPFCNINICYPLKVNNKGEEVATRGYTVRFGHDKPTTDGGDNQTRYNNAPNFYLLYFIDRLFKDLKIHIDENQAKDVEDLRRVFLLNYGCHYEEIEDSDIASFEHKTPDDKKARYGQYYIPIIYEDPEKPLLVKGWQDAGKPILMESYPGKVLMRNIKVEKQGYEGILLTAGSVEGRVVSASDFSGAQIGYSFELLKYNIEERNNAYSAYKAYATGDNYPNVEISDIINAMKTTFGVRLLFSDDYKRVRIVLLRNVFRSTEVQELACDIIGNDEKVENGIRGFRMTYNKGTEDTNYYYKGFNDLFPRASKTWKDTSDKHDYSQWDTDARYDDVKQRSSAMNRTCYITPANGNAYLTKVDEEESVLFPTLMEVAAFIDAEDGDCSKTEDEGKTIEEVQVGSTPLIMNEVNLTYASLFTGDLNAPSPDDIEYAQKIATFGRVSTESIDYHPVQWWPTSDKSAYFRVSGLLDIYLSEGFRIRMEDNYSISNGGTPFDEADPGLCFGIMRSSGPDARVAYSFDPDDKEDNEAWNVVPGDGAIDHPDTCDSYGNMWDYADSKSVSKEQAAAQFNVLWPSSNASFGTVRGNGVELFDIEGKNGNVHTALVVTPYPDNNPMLERRFREMFIAQLRGNTDEDIMDMDRRGVNGYQNLIVELDSSRERCETLRLLIRMSLELVDINTMTIDNGVGSHYGRFSLKLRAEKLNPYFDPKQPESAENSRYLTIDNENLRGRGLCDQFYKEYSFWVRHARIVKRTVRMEMAQLLAIDMTKRVKVGDVTGFVRKMQYTVSSKTGLGMVTMEIMYI